MVKTFKLKKIILFFLCLASFMGVFLGVFALNTASSASALDEKASDVAAYSKELYEIEKVRPYWKGDIMWNETCLPLVRDSGTYANLRYMPVNPGGVLHVTNYDGSVVYKEGTDYTVDSAAQKIIVASGSSIPTLPQVVTQGTTNDGADWISAMSGRGYTIQGGNDFKNLVVSGKNGSNYYGALYTEGTLFEDHYLCVTYLYDYTNEAGRNAVLGAEKDGMLTNFDGNYYSKLRSKLVKGNTINMLVIGDSITEGSNSTASDVHNRMPAQPGYARLVADELERVYGVTVNFNTIAVGGTDSRFLLAFSSAGTVVNGKNGPTMFYNALGRLTYDYAIIAYGMNDLGAASTDGYGDYGYEENMFMVVSTLINDSPDVAITLINTCHRNPTVDQTIDYLTSITGTNPDTQNQYGRMLTSLNNIATHYNTQRGDKEIRVINMYSVSQHLANAGTSSSATGKRFAELFASNMNHPNDWFHRVYAMNVCASLINYGTTGYRYHMYSGDNKFTNEAIFKTPNINGWSTSPNTTSTLKAYYTDTQVTNSTFGVQQASEYQNGVTKLMLASNAIAVNYNAYDVTKPISWTYTVNPSWNGCTNDYGTGFPWFGNWVHFYGFTLTPSLFRAFNDSVDLNTSWNFPYSNGSIAFTGCNSTDNEFYGRMAVNDIATGYIFNSSNHTEDKWEHDFHTITVYITDTDTKVWLDGNYYTSLAITRSQYPNGYAYLRISSFASVILMMKDSTYANALTNFDKTTNAWTTRYDYATDGNGWAAHVKSSNYSASNYDNKWELDTNFGRQQNAISNGYSSLTLNSAYTVNYRQLSVYKPIQITYMQNPAVSGMFHMGLYSTIEDAHFAGLNMGDSKPGVIWMTGANTSVSRAMTGGGTVDVNQALQVQSQLIKYNVYGDSYSTSSSSIWQNHPVNVIFDIGDSNTRVWINREYMGTIPITRANFKYGVAYLGLGVDNGWNVAMLVKEVRQDPVIPDGTLPGTYDATTGYYTSRKDDGTDSLGVVQENGKDFATGTLNTITSAKFTLNGSWTFTKTSYDVTKEIVFNINVDKGVGARDDEGEFYIMLFDNFNDMVAEGQNGYVNTRSNYKAGICGWTGKKWESFEGNPRNQIRFVGGETIYTYQNGNYMQDGVAVVRIYLAPNAADSYVKINNVTMATGTAVGVQRSDFPSGRMYYSVISLFGQQNFDIAVTNLDTPSNTANKINSISASVSQNIALNTNIQLAGWGYSSPLATITFDRDETNADEVSTNVSPSGSGTNFTFTTNFITPQYMNRMMNIKISAVDWGYRQVILERTYSVRDYVTSALSSATGTTRQLLVDLLNYGAMAQKFTNRDTSDLANKNLSSADQNRVTTAFSTSNITTNVKANNNGTGTQLVQTSLLLGDTVGMRFYYQLNSSLASNPSQVSVEFNVGGVTKTIALSTKNKDYIKKNGVTYDLYFVDIVGLAPTQFDTNITATVKVNGTNNGGVTKYTVNEFIKSAWKNDGSNMSNLYAALYNYGASAKAYAGV